MKKLTRSGAVVLIIAATLLVYWPALRNGFVWDDTALILRDPLIRSWRLIPVGFRHFLFLDATASDFYRPIQRLSFVFDYQVFGLAQPWGWHLTSILVHAGAAVALFFAAEGLLAALAPTKAARGQGWISFGVAFLWAIHPLYTSAVTYVAGRADPLAALFGFTALALGLISVRKRPANHTNNADSSGRHSSDPHDSRAKSEPCARSWIWTLGAAICFFLAMLSKESGIIFLPIWLLFLAWRRETRRALIPWALVVAGLVAAYCGLRFSAEKVAPPSAPATPLAIRPILAARAFTEYAGLLVAPVTLRMERDVSTRPLKTPEQTLRMARIREYETLAGVLLLIGFGLWARYCFRHAPAAAFALAAFAIAYLPISNLLSLNATIAEHWLYVPGAFLWLAVFVTGFHLVQRVIVGPREVGASTRPDRDPVDGDTREEPGALPSSHPVVEVQAISLAPSLAVPLAVVASLAVCWVVFLGVRTFRRQGDWQDQRTFIERTIAAGGNSPRMLMNLANVEFAEGHPDTALNLYREALRRAPDQSIIWLGYASVLLRTHQYPAARDALGHAEKSPFLAPDIDLLRAGLENADTGRDPGDLLRQAVTLAPKNWDIRKRYIDYLHDSGKPQDAIRELQQFLKQADFRAESWRLFGALLEEQHQPGLAIEAYREAALRDVRDADSRAKIAAAR